MSEQPKPPPWYKSPALIGFFLTMGGFVFFALLGYFVSQWLVQK